MTFSQTRITVSHEQWLDIVREATELEPDPPVRRQHLRFDIEGASAMVRYARPNKPESVIERMCSVLEVSDHGMMLRSREAIAEHTEISIDANIGDEIVALSGTVVHCTETVGAQKIGVQLRF